MILEDLKKVHDTYRLWAFHGAPIQFRKLTCVAEGHLNWVDQFRTLQHLRCWDEERFEYRIDPNWDGVPKVGNYVKRKLVITKPKTPSKRIMSEYLERGELHPNLYVPTFFKEKELPIPEGVRYAWDVCPFISQPYEDSIDYTLLID